MGVYVTTVRFYFLPMPTFSFLVYFTLSHVTLLSHESHVQSHDHGLFLLRT